MLFLRKPYIFFTLFALCWLVLLLPIIVGMVSIRAASVIGDLLVEVEIFCWISQLVLGIVYWVSLYKTRKQAHTKRFVFNLISALLVGVGFLVFIVGVLPMLLWAALR